MDKKISLTFSKRVFEVCEKLYYRGKYQAGCVIGEYPSLEAAFVELRHCNRKVNLTNGAHDTYLEYHIRMVTVFEPQKDI